MLKYFLHRLLGVIPVLLLVGLIVFTIIRLIPGDPAGVMLGPEATPQKITELRTQMGLNDPIHIQLFNWLKNALRGDFGSSYFYKESVTKMIVDRLEPTLLLMALGLIFSILLGVPMGILAAVHQNTFLDRLFIILAMIGISSPNFWVGLVLIMIFAQGLGLFPALGYVPILEGNFFNTLRYLMLPALTLGLQMAAETARLTRSSMLEVMRSDYIRTAKAKGLSGFTVIMKHALKNAMIPTLTGIGMSVAKLAGGAVVTEAVFNIPGAGRLIVTAISRRDYSIIQGHILFSALLYVLINLTVDLIYKAIDPRVEYR